MNVIKIPHSAVKTQNVPTLMVVTNVIVFLDISEMGSLVQVITVICFNRKVQCILLTLLRPKFAKKIMKTISKNVVILQRTFNYQV